jgi:hypothetical protein
MTKILRSGAVTAVAVALLWFASVPAGLQAQRAATRAITIDKDDLGGTVTSNKGPEAGVWVIAETRDLPTKFVRIVVTDDRGRYLVPDLPQANYDVWVRGYGLVDSKPVQATPGKLLDLRAQLAPTPRAAAEYYPASYWYSLLQPPPKSSFPMEKEGIKTQAEFIARMKSAVQFYQVGDKATREVPEGLGKFKSTVDAMECEIAETCSLPGLRRLARPYRSGRTAAGTAPAAGSRTQRRHHGMGLGGPKGFYSRCDDYRRS